MAHPDQNYEFRKFALKVKFAYSITGLILGLACILTGLAWGIFAVAGLTCH